MRTPTVLRALDRHQELIHLQGAALTATASHVLCSPASPLPALWLHPEAHVVASLMHAHRIVLFGPSSAAAAVLLQAQLAELRGLAAALPGNHSLLHVAALPQWVPPPAHVQEAF